MMKRIAPGIQPTWEIAKGAVNGPTMSAVSKKKTDIQEMNPGNLRAKCSNFRGVLYMMFVSP
jgi:hypothetical protein